MIPELCRTLSGSACVSKMPIRYQDYWSIWDYETHGWSWRYSWKICNVHIELESCTKPPISAVIKHASGLNHPSQVLANHFGMPMAGHWQDCSTPTVAAKRSGDDSLIYTGILKRLIPNSSRNMVTWSTKYHPQELLVEDFCSDEVDTELFGSHPEAFKCWKSSLPRVNTALFTASIFQKHLVNPETAVSLLEELSEKRLVEHLCRYEDTESKFRVEYTVAWNPFLRHTFNRPLCNRLSSASRPC